MTSPRTIIRSAVAALSLAGAALAVSVTQSPAEAAFTCPANAICLYDDIRYGSPQVPYQPLAAAQNLVPRDTASSWRNNSGRTVCAYDRRTGRPDQFLFVLTANGGHSDWVGSPVNDRADYIKPC
jgi:hypothetical protein